MKATLPIHVYPCTSFWMNLTSGLENFHTKFQVYVSVQKRVFVFHLLLYMMILLLLLFFFSHCCGSADVFGSCL